MECDRTFSGSPWEERAGYCRALRIGNQIFVSGTAPIDDVGETFAPEDAYAQTKRCFEIIQKALQDLGADLPDIVRTRLFVTDITCWEAYARAHQEIFADCPPVNTMVEINRLIHPDMLVEVEVEAYCQEPEPAPHQPLLLAEHEPARRTERVPVLERPIAPNRSRADMDVGFLD